MFFPIKNTKEKQRYYGALNLSSKKFILTPHVQGNGENTVVFIQHLQSLQKDKKLIIICDGVGYHKCKVVRTYLDKIYQKLEEKYWKVTYLLFTPNAPAL